jgi:hypothetical protein
MCVSYCNTPGSQIKIFPVHFVLHILTTDSAIFWFMLAHCIQAPANNSKLMMCYSLIRGMTLLKQNLLTCALVAAVAFEILSL